MARRIACPSCDESEDLSGQDTPEGIRVTCDSCGTSWLRDEVAITCATCGGTDVEERPRALTQYSRGTQLSIVGLGSILLCRACDTQMIEWSESGRAVPFSYKSHAEKADSDDEDDAPGKDVLMTP